ncbi:MAG TPA: DUF3093 domain-containing protein [Streptosporangiaceae bacterium]|nr:DUF3093 domain-containing protein [Streptosporangiaceae bacterium]
MLLYRERLRVPVTWWLAGGATVLIPGTTLWAGFSVVTGLAVYLALGALVAVVMLTWGRVTIEVTDSALAAGRARLRPDQVSEVSAMDAAQSAALRGPSADPAAYLLIRPYLAESVFVGVADGEGWPYWLVATRRPAELAAAIRKAAEAAAARAGSQVTWDDDALDDHEAPRRRDGNARQKQ